MAKVLWGLNFLWDRMYLASSKVVLPFSALNASPPLAVAACSCGISVRRPQAQGVLLCRQQAKSLVLGGETFSSACSAGVWEVFAQCAVYLGLFLLKEVLAAGCLCVVPAGFLKRALACLPGFFNCLWNIWCPSVVLRGERGFLIFKEFDAWDNWMSKSLCSCIFLLPCSKMVFETPWQKCHCMCVLIFFSRFIKCTRNKEIEKSHDEMHVYIDLFFPGWDSFCLLSAAWVLALQDICQLSLVVVNSDCSCTSFSFLCVAMRGLKC